jgi:predicted DNA-binding helix-hairpin-helix protein
MQASERLKLLADSARYDLSCACGTKKDDHRKRGPDGLWLYPAALPSGGKSIMLKTLLSSACSNDCRYCPLRSARDVRRHTLAPEEVADLFLEFVRRGGIHGLFLTSGVVRDPDYTMDRLAAAASLLRRKHGYRGYLHLKVIPGASDAAIEEVLGLASAVSLNVEVPKPSSFAALSTRKDYDRDIVRPLKLISRLTAPGAPFAGIKQTTQFIVGASTETDTDIVQATWGLYHRWHLGRVYYSAYQRGLGDPSLPGERPDLRPEDLAVREHRLYQVDWLLRKYGFDAAEIPFESNGNLSLSTDPKQMWADRHPDRFPVDVNRAEREELLRVPGLGPVTVDRILNIRTNGGRVWSLDSLGRSGKRLAQAARYLKFGTSPLRPTSSTSTRLPRFRLAGGC